jgi:hypothetical protein
MKERFSPATGALWFAAAIAAGCGQIRIPDPLTPPRLAAVGERAPGFTVESPEGLPLASRDLLGRVLVVVGCDPLYARELGPWVRFLRERYGEPEPLRGLAPGGPAEGEEARAGYVFLAVAECTSARALPHVARAAGGEIPLSCDPPGSLNDAFGLTGEGPHLVAVGADGTLLALLDGPFSEARASRLAEALDPFIPRR